MKPYVLFLILFLSSTIATGQKPEKSYIKFNHGLLYVGVNNYFKVVTKQGELLKFSQLKAYYTKLDPDSRKWQLREECELIPSNDLFIIRPNYGGNLCIIVTLEDGTEEHHIKPLEPLIATARVGRWTSKTLEALPVNFFRAQSGLFAIIENFDITGKCLVKQYEVIRIVNGETAGHVLNIGGQWTPKTAALIRKAQPGDRYIFTKILYRCPGAIEDQSAETMIFTLK
ncbi:MAG: GldM family protein [Bacteroidota bacterium]